MPERIECPGCLEDYDISVVKRESVPVGQHFTDYVKHYRYNVCGQVWTTEPR